MFTTHCFIRKNTLELRNKLQDIGYRQNIYDKNEYPWLAINHNMFISVSNGFERLPEFNIDCGENEDLFLALAALRDDSNYMQLFTDGEKWFQNKQNDIDVIKYGAGHPINFHKATVEELIKFYNK